MKWPVIAQIVDRDCYTGWSDMQACRHVISRLADGHSTFASMPRAMRRSFLRAILDRHHKNQSLVH